MRITGAGFIKIPISVDSERTKLNEPRPLFTFKCSGDNIDFDSCRTAEEIQGGENNGRKSRGYGASG
ncbi:hypothetical protein KCTCHS21_33200 [Cohnella abietis]|uniref:Uncharacterized protein n=1 Tax=Cohnella abietis TaxID=2507935 RepID=A0A3T1D772_9BACL|nr:hypothetical protein KCTCHS21_33200 [Cohnella abietis]